MKLIILGFAIVTSSFTSCNSDNSGKTDTKNVIADSSKVVEQASPVSQKDSASIQNVVADYLNVKNALVAGKSKEAAEASKSLKTALDKLGGDLMSASEQKAFTDLGGDTKEHAEHIGANAGNIKHQREHFQMLSKDIYDLLKAFGTTQTLYKDYCPMVKAIWLSETKPIKNPYYGSSMLTCGEVQETVNK